MVTETAKQIQAALEHISTAIRGQLWEHTKQLGLSPIQIQFLLFIASQVPKSVGVAALADKYNLTRPTVSDAVSVLVKKGLLEKQTDPKDRRRQYLKLTDAGQEVLEQVKDWNLKIISAISEFSLRNQESILIFLLELIEKLKNAEILSIGRSCLSCRYLQTQNAEASESAHFCLLRNVEVAGYELRLDCPNYVMK
ncbi:MAG: MarR family transcriptional regulator [Calditrichia bacterium]